MADDAPFLARWSQRKARSRQGLAVAEPAAPLHRASAAPGAVWVPSGTEPGTVQDTAEGIAGRTAGRSAGRSTESSANESAERSALAPSPLEAAGEPALPPPTLADVAALTQDSDYARFVTQGVATQVKHAALRKLFSDPRFNVMDGLDIYIDDYHTPDPLPAGMFEQLRQSRALGLLADDPVQPPRDPHEDPDLRLQPDDPAGRAGPEPGPEDDPGREP